MSRRFLAQLSIASLLASSGLLLAAEPDANVGAAAASVADALVAEAEGDFLKRQRLLAEAELDGDFAPAKWQRGQLQDTDGAWTDIQSDIDKLADNKKLTQYEQSRAKLNDTFENHLSLATACAQQGLFSQCRAHLSRAMEFQPDNPQIRQALGYRLIDGDWVSPSEVAEFSQRMQTTVESVAKYRKMLLSISKKLGSTSEKEREAGANELRQLKDLSAVPAVESILASPSPAMATLVIDWMAENDCLESSQALARYSLAHPVDTVRKYAVSKLKQRPLHDFVPDMLEMLASHVSMMALPVMDSRGELTGYRHAFAQEKFDKQEIMFIDRSFQRTSVLVRDPNANPISDSTQETSLNQAVAVAVASSMNGLVEQSLREFAAGDTAQKSATVNRANAQVTQRNSRIASVLSEIAEQEFSGEPKKMWRWWDKYNETKYQEYKPERYVRTALSNRVPQYQPERFAHECFVAGTQVVTSRGMKPIERVIVGDNVLSRNVVSGELSWKPVLRATTRPPETTSIVNVENEKLQCTYGHLFWVSGTGWKKANELKAGDILHAAEEPRVVVSVKEGAAAPTFNLEVADNANYFVGKAMIMTHDVTPRSHNRQLVPGAAMLSLNSRR